MLIEKLRITGHPAIGNVELDFRDESGEPARIVVIAGVNGVGKTVVLEAIHSLFEQSSNFPCQVDADLRLDEDEGRRIVRAMPPTFTADTRRLHLTRWPRSTLMACSEEQFGGTPFGIDNGPAGFSLRTFYSEANVLYNGNDLQTVAADELDRKGMTAARAGNVQGQHIPQLLLALHYADLNNYYKFERKNSESPIGVIPSLVDRFRHAFEIMFPHKALTDFKQEHGRHQIIFEENGIETTIHQLSTGEKQVVFRAGFFIRDAGVMQKDVILIDEPELSLSPDWQSKILAFYARTLSIGTSPHPQIICATHSPFIVHSVSAGKVIVLQRENDGCVRPMTEPVFPGVNAAIAVRAFNLDRFIREARPNTIAVITEGKTDVEILKAAWKALHPNQPMPFTLYPGTGARALQSALNGPNLLACMGSGKIVGLFDFDDAWSEWNGVWKRTAEIISENDAAGHVKKHPDIPAWAMLLPVPDFRQAIASSDFKGRSRLSIELMFPPHILPPDMVEFEEQVGGGNIQVFRDGCKVRFAERVEVIAAEHFSAFGPLFDRLGEIMAY